MDLKNVPQFTSGYAIQLSTGKIFDEISNGKSKLLPIQWNIVSLAIDGQCLGLARHQKHIVLT